MRCPGWEYSLVAYANAQLGRPFLWGETDCFSLAREALGVILAPNPLANVPGYTSREEADEVAGAVLDVADALERLGAYSRPISFAQQGDVVTIPGDDGSGLPRFGFVPDGRGRLMTSDPTGGVEILPLHNAPAGSLAWRF
uniref:DUF6950 domain-containing protein n=1 Tax=viral metagenome TaxID=1070528 RepID=A0A6M3XTJ9_9ZZZZ